MLEEYLGEVRKQMSPFVVEQQAALEEDAQGAVDAKAVNWRVAEERTSLAVVKTNILSGNVERMTSGRGMRTNLGPYSHYLRATAEDQSALQRGNARQVFRYGDPPAGLLEAKNVVFL